MNRASMVRSLVRLIPGSSAIVILAAGLGLAFNFLNPNGLPLVRKPLRETRRFVTASELFAQVPSQPVQNDKPADAVQTPAKPTVVPVTIKTPDNIPSTKPRELTLIAWQPSVPSTVPPKVATSGTVPASAIASVDPAPVVKPQPEVQKAPEQPKKVEALFTNLKDAKALFDKKAAIFLDGREAIDYEAQHIPGSLSLFCEKADDLYEKVLTNVPKDKIIVTYCSDPECTEAIELGDALVAKGYTRVVILLEGLPGWNDAGYPTTKGKEPG